MENHLWIYSDDKKWCIDKTIFSELFEGTPILNSIKNFNDSIMIDEYRFLSISPEYCDIFIKILRKEISLFKISTTRFDNVKEIIYLPQIHYDFFGVDYIKEYLIKLFFTTDNIKSLIQSNCDKECNFEEDFNFEILDEKFTIFDILKYENVDFYNTNKNYPDISLKFSRDNKYLKNIIDFFNLTYCIFTKRTIELDIQYKDNIKREDLINHYFDDIKFKKITSYSIIYSHYYKLKDSVFDKDDNVTTENIFFLDNDYPIASLTKEFVSNMNALALFFNDDKFIHKDYLNYSFIEYKNRTNDDIVERRTKYFDKIVNYVNNFKDFYTFSYEIVNKEFKYYIETS